MGVYYDNHSISSDADLCTIPPRVRGFRVGCLRDDLTLACQELVVVIDHAVKFASCELSANES